MQNTSGLTLTNASVSLPETNILRTSHQLAYSLPTLGTFFLIGPIGLIQGIYAKYFGLALTSIAAVLLISRLFDALTDPLIGYLSDKHHARTGSRKGFIVCGCALLIVSSYFLWVPVNPSNVDSSTKVSELYFLICFLAFYLSHTLFEIPHLAWGSELAVTANEKNSIFAWRLATATFGGLLFYLIPLLPIFETSEITPKTLQWTALAGGFIILPTVLASIIVLPSKGASNAQNKQREHKLPNSSEKIHKCHRSDSDDSRIQLSVLIDNKPLLLFLFALLFTGMAIGMLLSLLFIFIDSYLKMGQHYALATLLSMAASIVSLKFWVVLATKLGKQFAWGTGAGIVVVGTLIMAVLQPGEVSFSLLLLLTSLLTCGAAAGGVLAPSFLSEIIDYSRWKYKADCSASYFSLYTLMIKTNAALGAALGFSIAGLYGFDPSSDAYSLDSIFGLRLAVIWFPAAIALLSIVFISQIPMTTRRYSIIRRRLDGRVGPVSCSENIGVPVEKRSLIEDSNSV